MIAPFRRTAPGPPLKPTDAAMDATLSEEFVILRDTVAQLTADLAPESPEQLPAQGPGEKEWLQLAEMGLLGMRLPESAGGMPTSGVEVALTAEELGKRLVPLPFIGSAVLSSSLLAAAEATVDLLESLASGSRRLAPVLDPSLGRLAFRGESGVAWEARGAEAGLVIDRDTKRLAAVRLGGTAMNGIDLTRELRHVDAAAETIDIGDLGGTISDEALDRSLALTLAALSADLVGQMQAALDAAVLHVREREQFGVPVGTFQAVQHMAAEAQVSTEAARGLAWHAGWAVDELDAPAALLAARTAKAYCSEQARSVVETSMQMHGGVAFTWEYMVHLHVRRALLGRQTLGDEHSQLDAIADLRSPSPSAPAS
jgi:alkylation response protein AidB-like acyl-CoA dehydrogenase